MNNDQILDKVYKPMHTLTTSARVQMAVKENDIVKHAIETARQDLAGIEKNSQRALDVRAVENLMSAHFYYFWANKRAEELDLFWSKEHEDIAYGLENKAYVGREALYNYYVVDYGKMQAEKLKKLSELLGVEDIPENLGVGDMALDLSTSPFIEIAEDGQTAQGLVITLSYRIEINEKGTWHSDHIRSRFGFDFVKEGDKWKIWHIRQLADICLPCASKNMNEHRAFGDSSFFPKGNKPSPNSDLYTPTKVPTLSPGFPLPYATWSENQAFVDCAVTKTVTVSVNELGEKLKVPKTEAQLPPGSTVPPGVKPMLQYDWSIKPYLKLAGQEAKKLADNADEVELEGGGASWIFTALANALKPSAAKIYIPPIKQYVTADPIKMGKALKADSGVIFTTFEDGNNLYVQVHETNSSADQGEMARKFFRNARIPATAPGKNVFISGMMPNFVAVSVALGYSVAGSASVSIKLITENNYTCCISDSASIEIGDKI